MEDQSYPAPIGPGGIELINQGKTLTKIEAGYQTAIAVQRPRKLKEVTERCLSEADIAGEAFYWTWQVWDNKEKKYKTVEGPSIDLAMTVARNFGNCAVPTEVVEIEGEWIFRAAFVDLETGFTFQRVYRVPKSEAPGKFDQDRWDDMTFQRAQSKAQRNVIIKGAPPWLIQQTMDRAKEAALKGIGKMGKETAKTKVLQFFMRYQVTKEMLEKLMDESIGNWTEETLMKLRGIARTLQDGQETVETIFGHAKSEFDEGEKTILVAAFWSILNESAGIKPDDEQMLAYIKETAQFVDNKNYIEGESEKKLMADLSKAFQADPSQVELFVKAFRLKHQNETESKPEEHSTPKRGRKKQETPEPPQETQSESIDEEKNAQAHEFVERIRPDLREHIKEKLPYYNDDQIMLMMSSKGMLYPEKMTEKQIMDIMTYVNELYHQRNIPDDD